jgi:hypothetical protein
LGNEVDALLRGERTTAANEKAPQKAESGALQALRRWRDPDSNRDTTMFSRVPTWTLLSSFPA